MIRDAVYKWYSSPQEQEEDRELIRLRAENAELRETLNRVKVILINMQKFNEEVMGDG